MLGEHDCAEAATEWFRTPLRLYVIRAAQPAIVSVCVCVRVYVYRDVGSWPRGVVFSDLLPRATGAVNLIAIAAVLEMRLFKHFSPFEMWCWLWWWCWMMPCQSVRQCSKHSECSPHRSFVCACVYPAMEAGAGENTFHAVNQWESNAIEYLYTIFAIASRIIISQFKCNWFVAEYGIIVAGSDVQSNIIFTENRADNCYRTTYLFRILSRWNYGDFC